MEAEGRCVPPLPRQAAERAAALPGPGGLVPPVSQGSRVVETTVTRQANCEALLLRPQTKPADGGAGTSPQVIKLADKRDGAADSLRAHDPGSLGCAVPARFLPRSRVLANPRPNRGRRGSHSSPLSRAARVVQGAPTASLSRGACLLSTHPV